MLDLKFVTENLDFVLKKLEGRNGDFSYLKKLPTLQEERKQIINDVEAKKAKRNEISKLVGQYKREGKDAQPLLSEVEQIKVEIPEKEARLAEIEKEIFDMLAITPNLPADEVPLGKDDKDNVEIRKWGQIRQFDFPIKDHVAIGESLGILDFERAAKITGTRFVVDMGLAGRLERSLIAFMMDLHASKGYKEVIPPYIVNEESMFATGQFPKFKEDSFNLAGTEWYLNPTAEVPTITLYRDEIIPNEMLPIRYVAFTTAFRAEAGSAGRDTRGILRQH